MRSDPDFGFDRDSAVVVTGAASGIGRAIARRAGDLGLRVSAWDLDGDRLATVSAELEAAGTEVHTVVADVASPDAVTDGFAAVRERFGDSRYLVNNAGPSSAAPMDFDDALRGGVGSVRRMTETWLAHGPGDGAAMVATSSVAGNLVGTESDWYSAGKAAVMGYVRHLAAHRAGEARYNAVAPGMTDTPRLAGFADSPNGRQVLARNLLGRMATPDDIAWAVLFLLSPLACYVNGVLLPVDGGWMVTQ